LLRKYILGPSLRVVFVLVAGLARMIPRSAYRLDRPIFVVGCSRSGTDLFVNLFGMHEDLANWSEAGQIFDVDYYNPEIDHYKDRSHVKESDCRRIRIMLGLFTRLRGKRRFVNKHPQNSLRIAYLKAIFPDALFIHVVRDGRAVLHSHYKKLRTEAFRRSYPLGNFPKPIQWREYRSLRPVAQYACQWRDIVEYVSRLGNTVLSPNEYAEVMYEEFCHDVHAALRKLDDFCGLDASRRNHMRIPQNLPSQNYKWRLDFDEEQTREIESLIGGCLEERGYQRSCATIKE